MPRPGCFNPEKDTWYPLYRRLGGPQGQSGWDLNNNNIYIYMRFFILPNKGSVNQQKFLSVMLMYSKVRQILGAERPSQSYGSNLRPEATVFY